MPTVDLTPLTQAILISDEMNASGLLKVDEGLILSERSDCLRKDCAFNVWNILEGDSLGFADPNSDLELGIGLKRFQTQEEAYSNAQKPSKAGDPGVRLIEIPIKTLPKQSSAWAEDGRLVVVTIVHGNIQIFISLSESTWKINQPEKAVALLANAAKLQIDKLALLNKK